jgi:hypothetical protein
MGQTAPFTHVPIAAPDVLMNTPLEAVTVTLIEVYVPAGTARLKPTRLESVCSRVISYDVGVIGTVTTEPVDGVRVIPAIGRVKLRMDTPAGGRSERVILKFAWPPPQPVEHPPFFKPLQDPNPITATNPTTRNIAFFFMKHPRTEFSCRVAKKSPLTM